MVGKAGYQCFALNQLHSVEKTWQDSFSEDVSLKSNFPNDHPNDKRTITYMSVNLLLHITSFCSLGPRLCVVILAQASATRIQVHKTSAVLSLCRKHCKIL